RLPLVAEVLGYVGAVIAMTAIVLTVHQIWKHVPTAVEMATAGLIAAGLLLAGWALRSDIDPALARLRSVLWLLSTAGGAALLALPSPTQPPLSAAAVGLTAAAAAPGHAGPPLGGARSSPQPPSPLRRAVAPPAT